MHFNGTLIVFNLNHNWVMASFSLGSSFNCGLLHWIHPHISRISMYPYIYQYYCCLCLLFHTTHSFTFSANEHKTQIIYLFWKPHILIRDMKIIAFISLKIESNTLMAFQICWARLAEAAQYFTSAFDGV